MPESNAEKKFQHYAYARKSTQMLTETGKKFSFVNYKLVTIDQEIIDYLDAQIAAGMREVTKGELLTSKEADPMRAIKDAAVAEYKAEQAELAKNAALGISPDMGSTKPKYQQSTAASTKTVPAGGSTSNNQAAK